MFQRKTGRTEKERNGLRLARESGISTPRKCRPAGGMRLVRVCRLGCVSALINGLGRSMSFLVPSPLRKHSSRQTGKGSSHGLAEPLENEVLEERPRDVAFVSPLLEYGFRPAVEEYENDTLAEKPLLLYLPGFDGTYLSPFIQFPELGTIFDVRCMTVSMNDRSSFQELRSSVLEYLLSELALNQPVHEPAESASEAQSTSPSKGSILSNIFAKSSRHDAAASTSTPIRKRPVYLAGESFGGILASEVTLSLLEEYRDVNLKGLALVNAATCYDRSRLALTGPAVADYHPALFPIGLLQLLPLFTDEHSWKQLLLILQAKALPSVIDNEEREAYLGRVALSLPFVLPIMTQDALKWRLTEWLDVGCAHMSRRLLNFAGYTDFRVLIVAGEHDAALPSIAEAERLASILPYALVHVVEGAGHASTCGSRVDLAALFRQSYPELRTRKIRSNHRWPSKKVHGRTEMKPVAAAGKFEYFGMEPRYDNATIGINPLSYWSSKYYRKYKPLSKSKVWVQAGSSRAANETLVIH